MLCDTLPKVGKRSPQAKRPLNGVQTLGLVTVESQGRRIVVGQNHDCEAVRSNSFFLNEFVCAD